VIASITAGRTKLSLHLIASGKTERCEGSQFGDVGPHWTDHSQSGWTTEETFIRYLQRLRQYFDDGEPIWLLLDCYSAHRTDNAKAYAADIGVNLLFIPPGLTDELQPLDMAVFGMMKGVCRRLLREQLAAHPELRLTRAHGAAFLVRAWEQVSPAVLGMAWALYYDEEED